jgi:hypothetical protein
MEDPSKERKQAQLNDMVSMAEAVESACFYVEKSRTHPIAGETRNMYANLFCQLVTVYIVSDGGEVRSLTRADIEGGYFRDGGRELYFPDG